jgi:3-methyladenine DNA glycosylase Tag
METFERILDEALNRVGNAEALRERLPVPRSDQELRSESDDRYLSLMSHRIFRAGLKHSMVDDKWPAFEEVFLGFDPELVAMMSDEALETLLSDKRIIRHWSKIKSVRANAQAILDLRENTAGIGNYLADWPSDNIVGLWDDLKNRFTQLGGNSGPYLLRMAGKDTFLLTPYVVRALNRWGAVQGDVRNKRDRLQAQNAIGAWAQQAARPLCQVSMILALSVD